jgi:bifunctional non-homologous end joining protein LigD
VKQLRLTAMTSHDSLQQGPKEIVYAVFDRLYKDGKDLRCDPLSTRRAVLEGSLHSKRKGYEGIVAKDLSSPYTEGRTRFWLKVKVHQEDEFVIAGFTKPSGSRKYFGALLLGAYDKNKLNFVGKVGT